MEVNRFLSLSILACIGLAASTATATAAHRIHVPPQNMPAGVSPELVENMVTDAEQALERYRQASFSPPASLNAPNTSQFVTLQRQRVKVTIDWRDPGSGRSGRAYALPQADTFSFFYYDDPNNPEIFVKVLDFGNTSPFLIFYAGLTSFEYTVTFENVCTGQKAVKFKPGGSAEGGFDNTSLSWCDPQGSPLVVPGVNSINGATGDVTITGTGNATISKTGNTINLNVPATTGGVPSINGISGQPVSIVGSGGTSVSTSAGSITITSQAASGTGQDSVLPPSFAVGKRISATCGSAGGGACTSSGWVIREIQGGWIRCDSTEYLDRTNRWIYVPSHAATWEIY